MKNKKGLMQIPIIVGLMAVAIAIPVIRSLRSKKVEVVKNETAVSQTKEVVKQAEVDILIEPNNLILKSGEKKKVDVIVDTTKSGRKVDITRIVLCWNGGLSIADYDKDITADKEFFSDFMYKRPAKLEGLDCVDFVVSAQVKTADLKSGKLVAAQINFTGTKKMEGKFTINDKFTEVSGPANSKGIYGIQVGQMGTFTYQIN